MTSTETKTDINSVKDSCQVIATGQTLQTTSTVQPANQTTALKAVTEVPHRRTFEEQKPFIFSIIGVAVAYIAILIISQTIKNRIARRPLKEEE